MGQEKSPRLFHIFKLPPHQRTAVCGYVAESDPKSGTPNDKAYPRCEDCMMWFKSLCWKREESEDKS
jgi:hypothetical protein